MLILVAILILGGNAHAQNCWWQFISTRIHFVYHSASSCLAMCVILLCSYYWVVKYVGGHHGNPNSNVRENLVGQLTNLVGQGNQLFLLLLVLVDCPIQLIVNIQLQKT